MKMILRDFYRMVSKIKSLELKKFQYFYFIRKIFENFQNSKMYGIIIIDLNKNLTLGGKA